MRAFLTFIFPLFLLQGCAGALVVGAVSGAMVANDERPVGTQLDDTNANFDWTIGVFPRDVIVRRGAVPEVIQASIESKK